jgi:hypothetical protein
VQALNEPEYDVIMNKKELRKALKKTILSNMTLSYSREGVRITATKDIGCDTLIKVSFIVTSVSRDPRCHEYYLETTKKQIFLLGVYKSIENIVKEIDDVLSSVQRIHLIDIMIT